MIQYLILSTVLLVICCLYYAIFLRGQTQLKGLRQWLIFGVLLAMVAPILGRFITFREVLTSELYYYQLPMLELTAQVDQLSLGAGAGWIDAFTILYFAGAIVSAIGFGVGFVRLYHLKRNAEKYSADGVTICRNRKWSVPFTFWSTIYLPYNLQIGSQEESILIRHEREHMNQGHHWDHLLMISARVLFWFNPLIHWLHNELKALHELDVDRVVLKGADPYAYATLLVKYSQSRAQPIIGIAFAQSVTEKRLHMIYENKPKVLKAGSLIIGGLLLFAAAGMVACEPNAAGEEMEKDTAVVTPENKLSMQKDGNSTTLKSIAGHSDEEVYQVVERMPHLQGCEDIADEKERMDCAMKLLIKTMYDELTYPEEAKDAGIEGQVVAQFIVDKGGFMRDIKLARTLGYGMDEETLRVLEEMSVNGPKWNPGLQNGEAVHVKLTVPIRFKLD
jgi:TonB family protein